MRPAKNDPEGMTDTEETPLLDVEMVVDFPNDVTLLDLPLDLPLLDPDDELDLPLLLDSDPECPPPPPFLLIKDEVDELVNDLDVAMIVMCGDC